MTFERVSSQFESAKLLTFSSVEELRERASRGEGFVLYHGGLSDAAPLESIDLERTGTKQSHGGRRDYGGFYLGDETERSLKSVKRYAETGEYRNIHAFLIGKDARILDADFDTDRLTGEKRRELSEDYDLLRGRDVRGIIQYVLLNKDVVTGIAWGKLPQEE